MCCVNLPLLVVYSTSPMVKCMLFRREPNVSVTLLEEDTEVNLNESLPNILLSPRIPNVSSYVLLCILC